MGDSLTGRPWAQAPWELVTAPISAQAFRVAMAIQLHRRPDGSAPFPSQKRLAEMCHTSTPTVKRAVEELREAGILRCVQRSRGDGRRSTNAYTLVVPSGSVNHQGSRVIHGPGITDDPTEVEVSVRQEEAEVAPSEPIPRRAAPNGRARDVVWDALTAQFGDALTETAQSLRGKLARSLKATGEATAEEIAARCKKWPSVFPDATLTETALEKHWHLLNGHKPNGRRAAPPCEECGLGGGLHQEGCGQHVAV